MKDFLNALTFVQLPARHLLLQEGQVARKLFYLIKGTAKCYYRKDDREIILWFALDDDVAVSLASFIAQQPSVDNIQLVEDTLLAEITQTDFLKLTRKHPSFNNFYKKLLETYYITLEEQYREIHACSAKEKYEKLISHYPDIVQRVPLGDIAAYLGITQESLSRIRAER